jgi:cytochrome c oxidase subunit 4
LRILFGTLALLLALTFATVAITWIDLGRLNLVAALSIALIKASFVALYFMHLRWDRPFNAVVLITSLALVMLFVGMSLLDSLDYRPDLIPAYAPDMRR